MHPFISNKNITHHLAVYRFCVSKHITLITIPEFMQGERTVARTCFAKHVVRWNAGCTCKWYFLSKLYACVKIGLQTWHFKVQGVLSIPKVSLCYHCFNSWSCTVQHGYYINTVYTSLDSIYHVESFLNSSYQ
jgi:hypothetical protein